MHVLSYAGSYLSLSLTGTAEGIKDEVITFPFIILLIFYGQSFDLGIFFLYGMSAFIYKIYNTLEKPSTSWFFYIFFWNECPQPLEWQKMGWES